MRPFLIFAGYVIALSVTAADPVYSCSVKDGRHELQKTPCEMPLRAPSGLTVSKKEPRPPTDRRNLAMCSYHQQLIDLYDVSASNGYRSEAHAQNRDAMLRSRDYTAKYCAGI